MTTLGRILIVEDDPNDVELTLTALTVCCVQVFGRRDDYTINALLRPASKKRQGTKSREVCRGSAAGAVGILPRVRAC
jgi:hypothetical protein